MEKLTISPKKISGCVKIPPSKSMGHRGIICASLAKGISCIENVDYSHDMIATIEAMKALGTSIVMENDKLIIDGTNTFSKKGCVIDCNESGSTLRFLVPISIGRKNSVNFIGRGNLGKRPLTTFYHIFEEQGIEYSFKNDILDLKIDGELKYGDFHVKGNISSQFISGLLFVLPLLKGDSTIYITTEMESKGYVDLTLDCLENFGIKIENREYKEFFIKGNQEYLCKNYKIEGDYSQGAFYFCANFIGNNVELVGLKENSLQGDKECIEYLEKYKELGDVVVDAASCPDIIPVLAVAAALRKGTTNIINAGRLRIKECDRLAAIAQEINKIGGNVTELKDSLIIEGVESFSGGVVESYEDHRIAMSMAIASTCCKSELTINSPDCVKKSYPNFWKDFASLGGDFK